MEKLNPLNKIINKFYYQLFIENFKKKITYNFSQNYFRWDMINYLINKYEYKDYLEIGCDQNQLFSKINLDADNLCTDLSERIMHIVGAIIQQYISNSGSFLD